jgi:hypothetical protein
MITFLELERTGEDAVVINYQRSPVCTEENHKETSVRIIGNPAKIRIWHLQNISQRRQHVRKLPTNRRERIVEENGRGLF